jgi:hypothetical protein
MGAPIPVLGYRSRTDAVMALRAQGKSYAEIAEMIGVDRRRVAQLVHMGKRAKRKYGVDLHVSDKIASQLLPHAAERKVDLPTLALRILQATAEGGLIDAVLDDR